MTEDTVVIPSNKVESITLTNPRTPFTEKLKSIKLGLTFLFVGLFVWLLKDGSIGEVSFVSLTTIIIVSYFGGNIGTKFAGKK